MPSSFAAMTSFRFPCLHSELLHVMQLSIVYVSDRCYLYLQLRFHGWYMVNKAGERS